MLNIDDILASLETEKTAEEVFEENVLKDKEEIKEEEKEAQEEVVEEKEETVEESAGSEEKKEEEATEEEKEAEEKEAEEKEEKSEEEIIPTLDKVAESFNEWKKVKIDDKVYLYQNVKEASEIISNSEINLEEKVAKLTEAGYLKEDVEAEKEAELKKTAEEAEEFGRYIARGYYDELKKLAAADMEEEIKEEKVEEKVEEKDKKEEKVAEEDFTPAQRILATLYNQYYGE